MKRVLGLLLLGPLLGCSDDASGTEGSTTDPTATTTTTTTGSTSEATGTSMGTTTQATTSTSTDATGPGTDATGDPDGSTTEFNVTTGPDLDRATDGLVVLYRFNAGGGTVIQDVSGVDGPLHLSATSAGAIEWGTNTLTVNATTRLLAGAPTKIVDACDASDEVTMEVWVRSANNTSAGGVVMTLSTAMTERAFTMAQQAGQYEFRLNSGMASLDGLPAVLVNAPVQQMTHVVYTRATGGDVAVYIDGQEAATDTRTGTFNTWPADMQFALSAEVTNGFPFLGEFGLAAVYCRALTPAEVSQNFDAGF